MSDVVIKDLETYVDRLKEVSSLELREVANLLKNAEGRVQHVLETLNKPSTDKVSETSSVRILSPNSRKSTDKVFLARESRLSDMLEERDFGTLYNIAVATMIVMTFGVIASNYHESGNMLDLTLLYWSFGKLQHVCLVWFVMFSSVLATYGFVFLIHSVPSFIVALVYILWQLFISLLASSFTLSMMLPPASGFIVMCEQVRFSMKVHSFVRELSKRKISTDDSFAHYFYFLFAPTLLYRTNYPRTSCVRWNYVFRRFLDVALCIFFTYAILDRFCVPQFQESGKLRYDDIASYVIVVSSSTVPATLVFMLGFYAILHSWLNAFAELCLFADRQFYKDWWNADSFATFYRDWNGVVHDWLYTYLYVDTKSYFEEIGVSRHYSKMIAALFVFEVSAVVHEYIISCALGFFFPVLLIMFGFFGVLFSFYAKAKKGSNVLNVFMWLMLFIGNGLLLVLYSHEWFSRSHAIHVTHFVSATWWKHFFTSYFVSRFFPSSKMEL